MLKHLQPLHYAAMALRLEGKTYAEIGASVGRTEVTVRSWFQQEKVFRSAWDTTRAEQTERAEAILREAAPAAARRLIELSETKGMVGYLAAANVLDRVGLKAPDKVQQSVEISGPDGKPVEVKGSFDFDQFSALFANLTGIGGPAESGEDGTATDGAEQSVAAPHADAEASGLPESARS